MNPLKILWLLIPALARDRIVYAVDTGRRSTDGHRRAFPGLGPCEWRVVATSENEARRNALHLAWPRPRKQARMPTRAEVRAWRVRALTAETDALRRGLAADEDADKRIRKEWRETELGYCHG